MTRLFLFSLLLLLVPTLAPAQDVTLPATVQAKPGRITILEAQTKGELVRWYCGAEGVDLLPLCDKKAAFVSPTAGKFTVLCWSALDGKPTPAAVCVVDVSAGQPVEQFTADLQAAFGRETGPQKAAQLRQLEELYRQAAGTAQAPQLGTWGDLFGAMSAAAKTLGLSGQLPEVQRVIAAELSRTLPTRAAEKLDAAGRALAARTFTRVADALGKVGK